MHVIALVEDAAVRSSVEAVSSVLSFWVLRRGIVGSWGESKDILWGTAVVLRNSVTIPRGIIINWAGTTIIPRGNTFIPRQTVIVPRKTTSV